MTIESNMITRSRNAHAQYLTKAGGQRPIAPADVCVPGHPSAAPCEAWNLVGK